MVKKVTMFRRHDSFGFLFCLCNFLTLLTSLIRHSDFVISLTYERSHMSDDIVTELRTLDLRRSLHQACEIVSNAFTRNRALQAFQNQLGRFCLAHVTEHYFLLKYHRT